MSLRDVRVRQETAHREMVDETTEEQERIAPQERAEPQGTIATETAANQGRLVNHARTESRERLRPRGRIYYV